MVILKSIILLLGVVGLLLAFSANVRWFSDKDKKEFVQLIENGVDPNHPGTKKFLNEYFYSLPMTEEEKSIPIDKVVLAGIFIKHGENHKDFTSGVIKVRNIHGETSQGLCSLSELESWTETTPFWDWLAWSLLALSMIIQIIIFIFEQNFVAGTGLQPVSNVSRTNKTK